MKLSAIHLYQYNEPFQSPIITPKVYMESRKSLFVELITDEALHYFGECNAFETNWYAEETIIDVQQQTIKWFQQYKDVTFESFTEAQHSLNQLNDYPATRSMIMMAVYQAFHKLTTFNVDYGATINGLSEYNLTQLINTRPQRVKLKWTSDILKHIEVIKHLPFEVDLVVDANESIDEKGINQFKALVQYDILYIEEPFKHLEQLQRFQPTVLPPVAIDEKAVTQSAIIDAISKYKIDVVILKPFRLGGIDKVFEMINTLKNYKVKVVVGGMYEYGLSRYFTAMLAQYADYPSDITPAGFYFKRDIVENAGILKGGSIYFEPPTVNTVRMERIY
ncbi:o-succinylbenzoate synthase [Staphylococcus succinus]